MTSRPSITALLATCSCFVACGTETFVQADGGSADGASSDAPRATADANALEGATASDASAADATDRRVTLLCGAATCRAGELCCAYRTNTLQLSLTCGGECDGDNLAGRLACTRNQDCAPGEVCCGDALTDFPTVVSTCAQSCPENDLSGIMCVPSTGASGCAAFEDCTTDRRNGSHFPPGFTICQRT